MRSDDVWNIDLCHPYEAIGKTLDPAAGENTRNGTPLSWNLRLSAAKLSIPYDHRCIKIWNSGNTLEAIGTGKPKSSVNIGALLETVGRTRCPLSTSLFVRQNTTASGSRRSASPCNAATSFLIASCERNGPSKSHRDRRRLLLAPRPSHVRRGRSRPEPTRRGWSLQTKQIRGRRSTGYFDSPGQNSRTSSTAGWDCTAIRPLHLANKLRNPCSLTPARFGPVKHPPLRQHVAMSKYLAYS